MKHLSLLSIFTVLVLLLVSVVFWKNLPKTPISKVSAPGVQTASVGSIIYIK